MIPERSRPQSVMKTSGGSVEVQVAVRKHYYAAIAFVDSLIGKLLAELDALSLTASTIVIVHSDHGYFMGESGEWVQMNGTRPLIAVFSYHRRVGEEDAVREHCKGEWSGLQRHRRVQTHNNLCSVPTQSPGLALV